MLGAVARLQVETRTPIDASAVGSVVAAAFLDPGVEIRFQSLQEIAVDGIPDGQNAVFPELVDLLPGQARHAESPFAD